MGKESNAQCLQVHLVSGCECLLSWTDMALFVSMFYSSSPVTRTVIQRNLKKFNKGKCPILYLVWNNRMHQYRLGPTRSKSEQKHRGSWRMSVWTWVRSAILQQCRLPAHWTTLENRIICKFCEAVALSDSGGSQLGCCAQFLGLLQEQGQ